MKTVSWRDVLIAATAAAASTVLPAAALDAEEALLSEVDGPDWRLDEHLRCVMNASTSFFGLRLRPLASRARGPDPEAQGLDRNACWSSAWPAPDQIDQAWITDPMFAKSEHPIVIEAPEEVLQIRLQYPSDLAASNDLIGAVTDCRHPEGTLFALPRLGDIDAPDVRRSISLAVDGLKHRPNPFLEALLRPLHRLAIHPGGGMLGNAGCGAKPTWCAISRRFCDLFPISIGRSARTGSPSVG
jgi:hypothetical protein